MRKEMSTLPNDLQMNAKRREISVKGRDGTIRSPPFFLLDVVEVADAVLDVTLPLYEAVDEESTVNMLPPVAIDAVVDQVFV